MSEGMPEARAHIEHVIRTSSGRLVLRRPVPSDADELFRMYSDTRLIECDPMLAHPSITHTQAILQRRITEWQQRGHGLWVILESDAAGEVVGMGGCQLQADIAWNLSFSLRPQSWGQGYAQEVASAGMQLAQSTRPELPITAVVAERNERSQRAIDRIGLHKEWQGPDNYDPDPAAMMLLYADRTLSDDQTSALTH